MTWECLSLRLAQECDATARSRLLKNGTRRKTNYTSGSLPCFSGGRRRGDQSASIRSAARLVPLFLLPQQKPDNSAAARGGYFRLPTMETCKKTAGKRTKLVLLVPTAVRNQPRSSKGVESPSPSQVTTVRIDKIGRRLQCKYPAGQSPTSSAPPVRS